MKLLMSPFNIPIMRLTDPLTMPTIPSHAIFQSPVNTPVKNVAKPCKDVMIALIIGINIAKTLFI